MAHPHSPYADALAGFRGAVGLHLRWYSALPGKQLLYSVSDEAF